MISSEPLQPNDVSIRSLCDALALRAEETARVGPWQSGSFRVLAESRTLAEFLPADCGGTAAGERAILVMLTAIAEQCLTTALALTQWASAVRIIAGGSAHVRAARLPLLARGETTTTVGISQLSTSRRHLGTPSLVAASDGDGWRLTGICPWVTGADSSDTIVTGAVLASGEQAFFVVDTAAKGLDIASPMQLLALAGSRTSSVTFRDVRPADAIVPDATGGVRTGGLSTTALALGSTNASLALLDRETEARPALAPIASELRAEAIDISGRLMAAAGGIEPEARDRLRADSNSLVLRAAQTALTASKGAGFVVGHPAERLAREALFFLVWSCPQAVTTAVMCELAGL